MSILFKKPHIPLLFIAILATTFPSLSVAAPELLRLPDGVESSSEFLTLDTLDSQQQRQKHPEVLITADQAKFLYPYALASYMAHCYRLNRSDPNIHDWYFDRLDFFKLTPLNELSTPPLTEALLNAKTGRFEHQDSGLQARGLLHESSKTLILGFAGTDFDLGQRSRASICSSSLIIWSINSSILNEAAHLCQQLQESGEYEHIILTGSSLGGAVAQYAGIACDLPVVAFNSLALSKTLRTQAIKAQTQISDDSDDLEKALTKYKNNLILAKVHGEFLNNNQWLGGYVFQNSHPLGVPVHVIPPSNKKQSMIERHMPHAILAGLEKMAGYHFPMLIEDDSQ